MDNSVSLRCFFFVTSTPHFVFLLNSKLRRGKKYKEKIPQSSKYDLIFFSFFAFEQFRGNVISFIVYLLNVPNFNAFPPSPLSPNTLLYWRKSQIIISSSPNLINMTDYFFFSFRPKFEKPHPYTLTQEC